MVEQVNKIKYMTIKTYVFMSFVRGFVKRLAAATRLLLPKIYKKVGILRPDYFEGSQKLVHRQPKVTSRGCEWHRRVRRGRMCFGRGRCLPGDNGANAVETRRTERETAHL